jgi:hypothetical protein
LRIDINLNLKLSIGINFNCYDKIICAKISTVVLVKFNLIRQQQLYNSKIAPRKRFAGETTPEVDLLAPQPRAQRETGVS